MRHYTVWQTSTKCSGILPESAFYMHYPVVNFASADIAELLGMTQSAISHQLRVLKQSALVKFRRDGKTVYYSLADTHVATILAQGLDHVQE